VGRGRNAVVEFFETKWKKNMTLNAAVKLGLEALRDSLEDDLNNNAVEIAVLDKNGYRLMDREETADHIEKLPPLEE
jgi:proteasome alpha subunit